MALSSSSAINISSPINTLTNDQRTILKVKYYQLKMISDRGYLLNNDDLKIIDKFESVERSFQDLSNKNKSTNEIMDEYYNFAYSIYDPNLRSNYPMNPPRQESSLYSSLTNIYLLDEKSEYYSEYFGKTTLVWYYAPDVTKKEKSAKLPKDEAARLVDYYRTASSAGIKIDVIITISKSSWSVGAVTQFKDSVPNNVHFQFFKYEELMFNPTKHNFVATHRKLHAQEIKALNEEEGIGRKELPGILYVDAFYRKPSKETKNEPITDPICKWYDFVPGDIIEITTFTDIPETGIAVDRILRAVKYLQEPR